ncbi:MAG: hydrogenase maturation protease [Alphaproteobacteria bacterium]|nr:hydrogenase maturation protease [Alphaproteobacteria bacterium]
MTNTDPYTAKNLFLGIGNAQRGDDAVGPMLAEKLQDLDTDFAILPHSGEGASLIHLWTGKEKVVVVDAMKTSKRTGTIHRFEAHHEKLHYGVFRYSSHLFGLAEAVETSRALGLLPKTLIIYGIEGKDFTMGAPLTPAVAKALTRVEKKVREDLKVP